MKPRRWRALDGRPLETYDDDVPDELEARPLRPCAACGIGCRDVNPYPLCAACRPEGWQPR